jgi:hypothetical protein
MSEITICEPYEGWNIINSEWVGLVGVNAVSWLAKAASAATVDSRQLRSQFEFGIVCKRAA